MNNENEKKESKLKKFFQKFKKIKGFNIAIVVILVGVMCLIAFSIFKSFGKSDDAATAASSNSLSEYVSTLETKLSTVLSKIDGAGEVSCMITLSSSFEQKLAYEKNESTTSGEKQGTTSSNSSSSESVVYVSKNGEQQPVDLSQEVPKIAGVVVVAQGAKNVNTKLDIIRAVRALLNVDPAGIEVIVHK